MSYKEKEDRQRPVEEDHNVLVLEVGAIYPGGEKEVLIVHSLTAVRTELQMQERALCRYQEHQQSKCLVMHVVLIAEIAHYFRY